MRLVSESHRAWYTSSTALFFGPIVLKQLEESERWRSQLPFQPPPIEEWRRTTLDERMRQEIPEDEYEFHEWDPSRNVRCFVHVCNPSMWQQITGTNLLILH